MLVSMYVTLFWKFWIFFFLVLNLAFLLLVGSGAPAHHNSCLNDANLFIFSQKYDIIKRNISWRFGENPTWRRHFTSRDVIFAISSQKVLTPSINGTMGLSVLIFRMRLYNTFPTRGQPFLYDKRFNNYRIFTFCRIFDDIMLTSGKIMMS